MPVFAPLTVGQTIEMTTIGVDVRYAYQIINRTYWKVLSTPAVALDNLEDCRSILSGSWITNVLPVLASDYIYSESHAKLLFGASNVAGRIFWNYASGAAANHSSPGGIITQPFPSFVTASIKFRTIFLGRNWRGGVRLGLMPKAYQDATNQNKISAFSYTAIESAWNAYRADTTAVGGTVLRNVIASPMYYWNALGNTGPTAAATADVITIFVNEYFRTMRSREAPHAP